MSRQRFDALRAGYVAARERLDLREMAITSKYGPGWHKYYLSRAEARGLDQARAAIDKAGDAFYTNLKTISPRDWSYGVPTCWLYEKLTYNDAARPVSRPLSVVPPLAYGATVART